MEGIPTLSVVIASMGRPGLTQILADIQEFSLEIPLRIILVLDGVDHKSPNLKAWEKMTWKLIQIPRKVGPSVAYSIGLREVDTDFFRIFTDDDRWDSTSLRNIMQDLEDDAVVICNTNVQDELGISSRNSYFSKDSSPLMSVYAPLVPWKRNQVYFHLTSMIFPSKASKILFDESLVVREDLDWLQRIYDAGIKFKFSDVILTTVFPSHIRSAERQSLQIDIDWVNRLTLISDELARNFVYFHCFRSFAVNGEPSKILIRLLPLRNIVGKPSFYQSMSLLFYLKLSCLRKIQKTLRR
jgi:glycosyltransferase involved in cell wall biosynthesis